MFERGVYLGKTYEVARWYARNKLRVALDMITCFPYMCCALALPAASLERRLVQMLRVMFALIPAARALGRTFLAEYRSSFDPALVRLGQMAIFLCVRNPPHTPDPIPTPVSTLGPS